MSETNKNLEIWEAVETTDPKYTKPFNRGGGFRGTSTNTTYLAKKATKLFGPLGIGWGWTVLDEQYQPGQDKDVIHVLRIKLWYEWNGKRGEIEHFGQTQFVGKNKNGYYTDEEAPKKSLTDALSKCLSMLGFSADIYLGMYEDHKYVNNLKRRDFEEDFGGDNDNQTAGKSGKSDTQLSREDADKILDHWEDEISKCAAVKEVMELVNEQAFKDDLKKLHPKDAIWLKDKASDRSQELKSNKAKKSDDENTAA